MNTPAAKRVMTTIAALVFISLPVLAGAAGIEDRRPGERLWAILLEDSALPATTAECERITKIKGAVMTLNTTRDGIRWYRRTCFYYRPFKPIKPKAQRTRA